MSSFYGGKEGRTYNIVQRYDSVAQMVEAFSGGGAYTGANYGLYVIIDTIMNLNHKNDLENGLLYRRGFDYNDAATNHPKPNILDSKYYDVNHNFLEETWQKDWADWVNNPGGGAIYVGQIVGPQGDSPELTPVNWNTIKDSSGVKKIIPVSSTMGNDSTPVKDNEGNDVWNGDTIKVASVTIKDNDGNVTGAKIAFDIPNIVMLAIIENDDPYSNAGVRLTGTEEYDPESSVNHPFWYKWLFTIPKGKRGQDIEAVHIESGEATEKLYSHTLDKEAKEDKTYYTYDKNTLTYIVVQLPTELGFKDGIYYEETISGDDYLTYSVRDYTDSAAGALTAHLGRWPYRVINQIDVNDPEGRTSVTWENGTHVRVGLLYFTPEYPENLYWMCTQEGDIVINEEASDLLYDITASTPLGEEVNYLQKTKWRVVNIPKTAPAHSLYIDYTAGLNDKFENKLRNLDYLSVDAEGNVFAFYSDLENSYFLTKIRELKDEDAVRLTNDSLRVTYTDGTERDYPLKQILSIDFNKGNPIKDEHGEWVLDEEGKPVFDSEGLDSILKIRYKDGTPPTSFEIKRIASIDYNNDNINASQQISFTYLGGETTNITKKPINNILAFERFNSDNIYVLYSDPKVRAKLVEEHQNDGKIIYKSWTDPVPIYDENGEPTEEHRTYQNLPWYNLGSLGAQYHINGSHVLNDLKTWLQYGFRDFTDDPNYSEYGDLSDRRGWLVTVDLVYELQGEEKIKKHIYAYDDNEDPEQPSHLLYDNTLSHWYEIMDIGTASIDPSLFVIIDSSITNPIDQDEKIPEHHSGPFIDDMLWFVESYGHDNY